MIHLKNSGYVPKDAANLLSKADELTRGVDAIVRDTRVSRRYLEFDVSIGKERLQILVEKMRPLGELYDARLVVEELFEKKEAIEKARLYFNNERFWECHEILEGVWKKTYEVEKNLIQGIILVAAAFVHYQKNENNISLSIFRRALEKIEKTTGKYHDIDIDDLRNKVLNMITSEKIETFMI